MSIPTRAAPSDVQLDAIGSLSVLPSLKISTSDSRPSDSGQSRPWSSSVSPRPSGVWNLGDESSTRLPANGVDLRAHLTHIERTLISQALERSGGTVAHAARLLSLRRTTLVEKLRKLGMASGHEAI